MDNLTVEKRTKNWLWTFNHLKRNEVIYIAEENGQVVGFASGGERVTLEYRYDGELYCIYLLENYRKRGIGTKLVKEVVQTLISTGYKSMMVWVLELNPSKHFYQNLGAIPVDKKTIEIGGRKLEELALGWGDLTVLATALQTPKAPL